MKTKPKTALRILASALIVAVTLGLLQRLLMPKYVDGIVEGAFVAEYYNEVKDHDVLFVGDCEVYENFSPAVLWQDFGVNSYIRGSAEQYIFQSYYLLEDAFRYEKPEVVVFNIQSLQFSEAQSEAYNRMSLEGMRWSPTKVKAIFASMKEGEHFLDYLFPILRYHTRWSQLESTDFEYLFDTKPVSFNGYYMRVDAKPAQNVPTGKPLADYSFGDNAWKYLDRMADLCEKEGVQLVLIKAPSLYPYWYPQWEEQVEAYAAEKGLPYLNFLELQEETGIDYTTDTYDGGLHMNLSGAEKLSRWLGQWLMENTALTDRRGEPELSARWEEKLAAYEAEKQRQYEFYGITP